MSTSFSIPNDYTFTLDGGLSIEAMDVSTKLTGSSSEPIVTKVIGEANQPVATLVTGDANKPIASLITGDVNKPVTSLLKGDANNPITTTLQGNPQKPVATTVEIMNLPRFTLTDIKELTAVPKIRVRMPNYSQLCFKLLGMEIFSLCLSGEGQAITEPYVPNAYERCETDCCEPDTRPFPESVRDNPNSTNNNSTTPNPTFPGNTTGNTYNPANS